METNITGGYDNRVSSARPKTCHSICVTARAVGHPSQVASFACEATVLCFPHSSLSPPFHHANHVSNHDRTCAVDRAAIKRPKTRTILVTGGRTPRLSRTNAARVWGSPWNRREPPENWVVGCETRGGRGHSRNRPLTVHSSHKYTPKSSSLSR